MATPGTCVWLITGANRGIGFEMVKQLLQQPANIVIATARDPASATALNEVKSNAKGRLHVVGLDVADRESIRKGASEVSKIVGDKGIDYLVNNAGILVNDGHKDTAYQMDIDILERVLKTNVSGPAYVSQIFLPLIEKGTKKTIANISSTLGSKGHEILSATVASYCISKAALNMLTCKQAKERPDITAVSICPGWLQTDMGGEAAALPVSVGVAGVLKVISGVTPANSGQFINHKGEQVPW